VREFPFPPRIAEAQARDWMSKMKDALDERFTFGEGSPEGVVTANPGKIYINTDGGAGTTFWVKETGVNTNTGWDAK
jgi:hypothetical protein